MYEQQGVLWHQILLFIYIFFIFPSRNHLYHLHLHHLPCTRQEICHSLSSFCSQMTPIARRLYFSDSQHLFQWLRFEQFLFFFCSCDLLFFYESFCFIFLFCFLLCFYVMLCLFVPPYKVK